MTAARKALELVNLDADAPSKPSLTPYWNQREKAEVIAGCYQLYFVLVEITADGGIQGHSFSETQCVNKALGLLDKTAQAFAQTRAYHLRRAGILTELGEYDKAQRERDSAARILPSTFLDFYLLGDEQYRHGEISAALHSFQAALTLEPADFWSQCFLGLCQLRLKRPASAQASFTGCLSQKREIVWPRILRGLSYMELDAFAAAEKDFATALEADLTSEACYIVHVSRGIMRFRQKKLNEAVVDLEQAIALMPQLLDARITLAKVRQAQSDFALDPQEE
jgi:tetratricopeptide (TPR) repeat protein